MFWLLNIGRPLMHYGWKMDAIEVLKRTDLFGDLSEEQLARLAEGSRRLEISKGEHIFLEDEEGTEIYVLAEGGVRLYKISPDGQETTVKIVSPFETFAEIVLFDEGRYPVSAMTVRYSLVFALARRTFQALLDERSFRHEFIKTLIGRLRYLSSRIHYLTAHDVEERFFLFLLDQCGPVENCSVEIPKKDIAAAIGTTPETLSRLILRLRKRGDIEWKGNSIRLREGFWDEVEQW